MQDLDPVETQEWLDALESVLDKEGEDRAHYLLTRMGELATRTGTQLPHFWEALAACGSPRPVAIAKACTMAEAARDFGFLTDYCPSLVAKACASADAA